MDAAHDEDVGRGTVKAERDSHIERQPVKGPAGRQPEDDGCQGARPARGAHPEDGDIGGDVGGAALAADQRHPVAGPEVPGRLPDHALDPAGPVAGGVDEGDAHPQPGSDRSRRGALAGSSGTGPAAPEPGGATGGRVGGAEAHPDDQPGKGTDGRDPVQVEDALDGPPDDQDQADGGDLARQSASTATAPTNRAMRAEGADDPTLGQGLEEDVRRLETPAKWVRYHHRGP